jgi:1,4-dihydroxy-6-naphthoate synthase
MTSAELTLGFSPCPNDTFTFYALVHGKVKAEGITFRETIEDVEALNRKAVEGVLDVTKLSFHAYGHVRDEYVVLRSGAALGKGCGPLIVAREKIESSALKGKKIAIPGGLTTANLLLMLYEPSFKDNLVPMVFSRVMDAVRGGEVDAGLVIHEGRFTFKSYGLEELLDLGHWWESAIGLPIPLGGIAAKRSLGKDTLLKAERAIRESVLYAFAHQGETKDYVKGYAQEMDDRVIESHIGLYVNDYTVDMKPEGEKAISALLDKAAAAGLVRPSGAPLFIQ